MDFLPCALIPVYNHHSVLASLVSALDAQGLPLIIVDDGSNSETRRMLDALVCRFSGCVSVVRLSRNQGKGAAVLKGLSAACARGFTHAVQIDADGQHDPADASALLAAARANPGALVSGTPRYDDSVPLVRYYGRWLTHLLVWVETLSRELADSMCGYRVYPIASTLSVAVRERVGARMDFDTEIMVRMYLAGISVHFVPVSVSYPGDGISQYRMFRDNVRMTWLHMRLLAGLAVRPWRRRHVGAH